MTENKKVVEIPVDHRHDRTKGFRLWAITPDGKKLGEDRFYYASNPEKLAGRVSHIRSDKNMDSLKLELEPMTLGEYHTQIAEEIGGFKYV